MDMIDIRGNLMIIFFSSHDPKEYLHFSNLVDQYSNIFFEDAPNTLSERQTKN